MVLKILLIISIILQIVAALVAIRLIRMTKYNLSWILMTIAFTMMAVLRFGEYFQLAGHKELNVPPYFFVWIGVLTSLCFAVSVFYVKKIFNYIKRLDLQRKLTEKRILHTVLRTEEKERHRFSKELHDGLGPLLSSAKMSLSAIKKEDVPDQYKQILNNTSYVIEEAIHSLREISNNLSPHILNDFGLARGVSNFINKLPAKGIVIKFDTNLKGERFDMDVEVILYRVICELINNSIKHSEGTAIDLNIDYIAEQNLLKIHYSDNGRGFNPGAMMDVGMGLSNISSRISSVKGIVEITGSRNQGMKAKITVNLKSNEKGRKI